MEKMNGFCLGINEIRKEFDEKRVFLNEYKIYDRQNKIYLSVTKEEKKNNGSLNMDNDGKQINFVSKNAEISEEKFMKERNTINNNKEIDKKINPSENCDKSDIHRPIFNIDILQIMDERESHFSEKIKKIKDPILSNEEKRRMVLEEEYSHTYYIDDTAEINDKKKLINSIEKEKEEDNKKNKFMFLKIDIKNYVYSNERKTENPKSAIIKKKGNVFNFDFNESQESGNSTNDSNFGENRENQSIIFKDERIHFYLKNKLYDITLNKKNEQITIPSKYLINKNNCFFLYDNDLNTYYITCSGHIRDKMDVIIINNNGNKNYYPQFGLFFCGKNITIKNGDITKKCSPNNFMCNECINKNKNNYKIQDKYLININGRVVTLNKGSYHCFGHFLCGNKIEDCINKFTCKACQEIDSYKDYYSLKNP
jgi:hypothetical protein